jgi:hypothetical protein
MSESLDGYFLVVTFGKEMVDNFLVLEWNLPSPSGVACLAIRSFFDAPEAPNRKVCELLVV